MRRSGRPAGALWLVVPLITAAAPAAKVVVLRGQGAQVYECTHVAAAYAWQLKGPDAKLIDSQGRVAGRHFAGPSWQAQDGSIVVGAPVAVGEAPRQGDVPWLVLTAKSHSGSGLFGAVSYVVRSATQGGTAPRTGCDAAHLGAEERVDYTATYTFFSN